MFKTWDVVVVLTSNSCPILLSAFLFKKISSLIFQQVNQLVFMQPITKICSAQIWLPLQLRLQSQKLSEHLGTMYTHGTLSNECAILSPSDLDCI